MPPKPSSKSYRRSGTGRGRSLGRVKGGPGGKRRGLGKGSFLGLRKCDLSKLDLSKLLGGPQFLTPCTLSINGFGVSIQALTDTGANGYLFLNRSLGVKLSKSLGIPLQKLPFSVPIQGFQSKVQSRAAQYLRLHLTVDDRRVYNCPFILLDLGDQDAIIGIKWMKRFQLGINTQTNKFI
jgi:hypothetical protein